MKDAITSLDEQVKTRVTSVENGRKFQNSGRGEASMPDGAAIFETIGAWEDFSTPSRDLRLLIAIDVVRGFPDRVARRPERYAMPRDKSVADVKAELQSVLASELATRKFSYPRSDGSPWTLTLKDVIDRMADLEMAYNPNDCVELRWGAPAKSDEASTCKRYAPAAQRDEDDEVPRLVPRAAPAAAGLAAAAKSSPSRRGGFLPGWMRAALLAGARLLVGEERLVERRQVAHQMLDLDLDAVHQAAAFEAVPLEGVVASSASRFGSTTSPIEPAGRCGECRTCGGSRNTSPSRDRHVVEIAVVADLEHHVALELVEELLHRIVVIVGALVRAADHLHGHVAVLEHLLVADRRLEQVLVLVDPLLEVEGLAAVRSACHRLTPYAAARLRRATRRRASSPQVSNARRVASFSASVSSSIGGRTAAADLAEQLLPVFRMRRRLLGRPRAAERLAHRIEAVADRPCAFATSPAKARSV